MKTASRSVTAAVTVMVPNSLRARRSCCCTTAPRHKEPLPSTPGERREVPCFRAHQSGRLGCGRHARPWRRMPWRIRAKDVLGILLNWEKRYITLGPVATVLGLAFKSRPRPPFGRQRKSRDYAGAIPTNTPGVKIGTRQNPLNIPFQNGPTGVINVFIPLDWIIGGPERWARAGACGWSRWPPAARFRCRRSRPAPGKLACRATGAHAPYPQAFKLPIGKLEGVEEALARMAGQTYLMDATCLAQWRARGPRRSRRWPRRSPDTSSRCTCAAL